MGLYVGDVAIETINETRFPVLLKLSSQYIQYLLEKNPIFDVSSLSHTNLTELFYRSVSLYENVLGASSFDLSGYHDAGRNLLSWHGLSDSLVYPNGIVRYREEVNGLMGGRML